MFEPEYGYLESYIANRVLSGLGTFKGCDSYAVNQVSCLL